MGIKILFKVGSKVDVPDANQRKRKASSSDTTHSLKKSKLSAFDESLENESQTPTELTVLKRSPLTYDNLHTYQSTMSDKKQAAVGAWQTLAIGHGATSDHLRRDKIIKSSAGATQASPRSHHSSRQSSISSAGSAQSGSTRARGSLFTENFICFWGSPLSNWNQGPRFSGQRAMGLLIRRLDALNLSSSYPSAKRFATELLSTHHFNCGEQFMMACKAWLFETTLFDLAKSEWASPSQDKFEVIRRRLMIATEPTDIEEKAFYHSSLCRILRASNPRVQKELGRSTPNFSEEIRTKANMAIVVAGSIACAEADKDLAAIYKENKDGKRGFVEGSPYDRIWGVGLAWNVPAIEDKKNCKGENRLGRCHDDACRVFCRCKEESATPAKTASMEEKTESVAPAV